jgi:hypothetical protein
MYASAPDDDGCRPIVKRGLEPPGMGALGDMSYRDEWLAI